MQVGGSLHFGISNKRPSPQDPDSSVAERRVFEEIVETDEVSLIDEMAASDSELSQGGGDLSLTCSREYSLRIKILTNFLCFLKRLYERMKVLRFPSLQAK